MSFVCLGSNPEVDTIVLKTLNSLFFLDQFTPSKMGVMVMIKEMICVSETFRIETGTH
jgi:hypothetical protein